MTTEADTKTVDAAAIANAYAEVNALEWERQAKRRDAKKFRAWLARFAGNFIS